jgi:2-C-methyl-D-erythritol 4-phosphate cytidylyltransferase
MTVAVLVLAGGSGSRFGARRNKVYLPLAGRSVLSWSVDTLARVPDVEVVVLVTRPTDREHVEAMLSDEVAEVAGRMEVVSGGRTRQESELCGLRQLAERIRGGLLDTVLIHDGARPLVSAELAEAVIAAVRRHGGAIPGLVRTDLALAGSTPAGSGAVGSGAVGSGAVGSGAVGSGAVGSGAVGSDAVADGVLAGMAPGELVAVQTPQGFAAAPLLAAYERAEADGYSGTDTASCIAHYTDIPVHWVPGAESNFKITYAHDLAVAEAVLAGARR